MIENKIWPKSPAYYFDGKMFHWEEGNGTRWSVMQSPRNPDTNPLATAKMVIMDLSKSGLMYSEN